MNIDQEYINLIHAEIDGQNSETDSAIVREYLSRNRAARRLHSDLVALRDTLESVEDVAPPRALKGQILDAALGPVSRSKPRSSFGNLRYAYAIAAMLVLGVAISYFALQGTGELERSGMSGTMGSNSESGPVALKADGVDGILLVEPADGLTSLGFDLDCRSNTEIVLQFDPAQASFDGFTQEFDAVPKFVEPVIGENEIRWLQRGRRKINVSMAVKSDTGVTLQFLDSGESIYSRTIQLKSQN